MELLHGVRVLDVTTVIAAPFAAALMADFGADVIPVERVAKLFYTGCRALQTH